MTDLRGATSMIVPSRCFQSTISNILKVTRILHHFHPFVSGRLPLHKIAGWFRNKVNQNERKTIKNYESIITFWEQTWFLKNLFGNPPTISFSSSNYKKCCPLNDTKSIPLFFDWNFTQTEIGFSVFDKPLSFWFVKR